MIDRRTALVCAVLITLMLTVAAWRLILAVPNGASHSSLLLVVLPFCSALVVGGLYWEGRGARTDSAKIQPWRKWGKSLSINYCGGLFLLQSVLVVQSLGLDTSLDLSVIGPDPGRAAGHHVPAVDQPDAEAPWFERRFSPGGDLGPIYGPRYMRTQSSILLGFMIAVIAFDLTVPTPVAWRSVPYVLFGTALLVAWSIAWRCRLGRRWRLEQSQRAG